MKYRVLITTFLLFTFFISKSQSLISIDSIPPTGLVLQNNWKWHAGDNPAWADPEFDDHDWSEVKPTQDVNAIPQLTQKGIGWFRATLEFSPLVAQKLTTLQISQSVASEIYINGLLARKIGNIDSNPDLVKAVNIFRINSIGLPYSASYPFVQISIRVGYERNSFYNRVGFNKNHCFRAIIVETENANATSSYFRQQTYYGWFQVGVFFILTFLHIAFYFLYPSQRANLYFSGTTFFLGAAFFCIPLNLDYFIYLSEYFITELVQTIAYPIAYLFLIRAIYEIYHQKTGVLFWLIVAFGMLVVVSLFTPYSLGSVWAELGTELLMTAEVIRVTLAALRRQQPGARIIIIGMVVSLLMFLVFYVDLLMEYYDYTPLFKGTYGGVIAYQIAVLCVPLSISLYLAISFSKINKELIQKLEENNTLTQKNLLQEKEKQQLLEAQNETLERQVKERTAQLEQSLEDLKLAQNQLVQKEKLASLGELTAGIAHEIQNPLNFVNNFSELSVELIDEIAPQPTMGEQLTPALGVGDGTPRGLDWEIFQDIRLNLQKINHHGKRASSIVKGMLEHSRVSSGQKELTDINQLVEEFLRLSYHGLRATDTRFNADFKSDLDPHLPKINVIPQDIGRVLLNLINNAFYAVNAKRTKKIENNGTPTNGLPNEYLPMVMVTTEVSDNQVVIKVKDNGIGISKEAKAKIFQPFFTTKPTGQGTGLGLSLAYDIVTKGHGGSIEVESDEGVETTFAVKLPII
jgi:two-component system, NtrC family, sensor kinase